MMRVWASKVWRLRDRTGGFMPHFFTQNSRNIFFKGRLRRKADRSDRTEKLSHINDGAFGKTPRNSVGGGVAQ